MPFRDWVAPTGERFRVRVSDAALNDWLKDRAWLRTGGRPDRPPDEDTGPTRSWYPHPGEENLQYWKDIRASVERGIDVNVFPVYSAVWDVGNRQMKFLVHGHADGTFTIVHKMENKDTGEVISRSFLIMDADPNVQWEAIESMLIGVDAIVLDVWLAFPESPDSPVPSVNDYVGWNSDSTKVHTVHDEVEEEFGVVDWWKGIASAPTKPRGPIQ